MNQLTPPTSGFTAQQGPDGPEQDFFRPEEKPDVGKLPTQPDTTFTPTRIQFSIRLRFNPIRNLTPELLSQYLDSFRLGFFRNAALAWDAMERRDSRLQTVAPKRKKSVARQGWEILTVDDSPAAAAQKKFLQEFYNSVAVTTALEPDEKGGFALLVRQMMDGVGKRYAVHEIVWQPQTDGSLKARFIFCPLWWFEGTRGKLRFLLNEFEIYGVDMEQGGWLVTVGDGLMEACSVAYMFKHLPLRDWLAFSEKFGTPGVLGKTEAAIGSNEWNAMEDTVRNFTADFAAVTNQTNAIELVEARANGEQPFKPLVDMMNEEMTRLWRGADLGTSSKHNANGASLQKDETDILEADDAQMISETLDGQVTKYALAWKFGWDAPQLAYLKIKATESESMELDLRVDQFLLAAGAPLSIAAALERYNRPMPAKGDELLKATAPAPAPPDDAEDPEDPEVPGMANEQRAAASGKLMERGRQAFAAAIQDDLSHVLDRLNEILQITDDALFLKKLQEFTRDYPAFKKDILRDPAAARALQPVLGAALANGLATGRPDLANGDLPGHEFRGNQHAGGAGGGSPEDKLKDVLSGKTDEAAYAKVSPETAAKIKAATGKDVSGYQHFLDRDALTHIDRGHGVGKEDQPGHEPVTKDDIEKIPGIVAHPDKVEAGPASGRGRPTILYTKRFNGTTYYVEEEWSGEKLLAAKTMWRKTK